MSRGRPKLLDGLSNMSCLAAQAGNTEMTRNQRRMDLSIVSTRSAIAALDKPKNGHRTTETQHHTTPARALMKLET